MTDLSSIPALLDECGSELRRVTDVMDMRRILAERDDLLDYEHKYHDDHYGPAALMCGCRPKRPCAWHSYVAEELEALQ